MKRFKQWVVDLVSNPWVPGWLALAIGPMAMHLPHAEKWLVPYLIAGVTAILIVLYLALIGGFLVAKQTRL